MKSNRMKKKKIHKKLTKELLRIGKKIYKEQKPEPELQKKSNKKIWNECNNDDDDDAEAYGKVQVYLKCI